MKKSTSYVFLLFFAMLALNACHDEETARPGKIKFEFRAPSGSDNGRVAALPEGSALYVSIETPDGEPIETLKELAVFQMGEHFISETLSLAPGNYNIVSFFIADGDQEVLYATPEEGSPLAGAVDDPLPVSFSIENGEVTNVAMQVVSTSGYEPDDFGYVSFSIVPVLQELFALSVFRPEEGGFQLSSARVIILHEITDLERDTLYDEYLPAAVNGITFANEPNVNYTLVVQEHGHMRYSRYFTVEALQAELQGQALVVELQPGVTFEAWGRDFMLGSYDFEVLLNSVNNSAATFWVDWGDGGILEEVTRPADFLYAYHPYPTPGPHFVSIGGDLDKLGELNIPNTGYIREISLRHAPALHEFTNGNNFSPREYDFSHNPELVSLSLSFSNVETFNVSANPRLKFVYLNGNLQFSPTALNQIILDLYASAGTNSLYEGALWLPVDPISGDILGPPTPEAIDALEALRDTYNWTITPADF
ncbi:hypothetical protein [Parachryseolinea silvisoli]|uniref:hypothetical protein n=1 Tax=Parachryseolinea silvisoli TaxID=2873601 RepID=UPI0022658EF2|nr:hypothetical protein [Parachryseolinea silvisoli]MCD9019726.1 hypothetical protein [Parachryseolinea silvisoli]